MGAEWFQRLGDVPGLDYEPPVVIDRSTLPRHDGVPEVHSYDIGDGPVVYLSWGMKPSEDEPDSWTSLGSPAAEHAREALQEVWSDSESWPTERLLPRLYEALELPGEGVDYHTALGQAQQILTSRKLAEPDVVDALESLALIDIKLLLAHPAAVGHHAADGGQVFVGNSGFNTLIQLYRAEGFLRDAVELAELQQTAFPGSVDHWLTHIQERLETIRGEAAPQS